MLASTRRAIQYPNPDRSDRPDIPAHFLNLVNALEIDVIYVQGTDATRLGRTHMAGVLFYTTDTLLFWWDTGTAWVQVGLTAAQAPGAQLDYAQITASVLWGTATTEGTAIVVVNGASLTYDGTKVLLEFFCPGTVFGSSNAGQVFFHKDGNPLGQTDIISNNQPSTSLYVAQYDTPTAGIHQYGVKTFGAPSTAGVLAGAGGPGNKLPAWIRVSRA